MDWFVTSPLFLNCGKNSPKSDRIESGHSSYFHSISRFSFCVYLCLWPEMKREIATRQEQIEICKQSFIAIGVGTSMLPPVCRYQ